MELLQFFLFHYMKVFKNYSIFSNLCYNLTGGKNEKTTTEKQDLYYAVF